MSVPWTRKTRTSVLVSASFVLASWRHLRHSCDPDPRRARVGWPVPSSCAIHCSVCAPRPHPRRCPPSSLPRNEGLVGAPACGDVMKLQMRVGEDGRVDRRSLVDGGGIDANEYLINDTKVLVLAAKS